MLEGVNICPVCGVGGEYMNRGTSDNDNNDDDDDSGGRGVGRVMVVWWMRWLWEGWDE